MKVLATHYTATVLQASSFYACLGTWPSPTDWDRALLLPVPFIVFFPKVVDFFGSVLFTMSSNIVLFYSPTLPSNKIILPWFALCIFFMGPRRCENYQYPAILIEQASYGKSILFSSAHSTKLVSHVRLKRGWLADFQSLQLMNWPKELIYFYTIAGLVTLQPRKA